MLTARNVHVWRGERHLLKDVSFSLHSGELLQLVGPNGVGKTTLLRACSGLLPLETGEVLFKGESIERSREQFNEQLAYLAHSNALKPDLTAEENLFYELNLRRAVAPKHIANQLETIGIAHCAKLPARVLSAGQRRRLALARVILCDVPLWILDEPTTNLDAAGAALVEQLLLKHLQNGGAILAAAHHRLLAPHSQSRVLELGA